MKQKRFWCCLALLTLWILFIFCCSLKPANASNMESRRALELLQQICPSGLSMYFVRKLAHFTEFAVLGLLAELLFAGQCRRPIWGLLSAAMTGVLIALCDETIQLFVAGRSGRLQDVWLDAAGACTGAVLALLGQAAARRIKNRRK